MQQFCFYISIFLLIIIIFIYSYPYELMGEEKVKESTMRLIKASKVLKENYGKIFVEFCEPISVK